MTQDAVPLVTTRRAEPLDAALLASLAASTFRDTFGADNTAADMAAYTSASFGDTIQRAELHDVRHTVFFAERAGEAVGYAMLREGAAPDVVGDAAAIEIARLYAAKDHVGTGIGATLMRCCLEESATRGRRTIWLGVWEHNAQAIAFYRRWGFADVGTTTFLLGKDSQTDRVMARRVSHGAEEG